MSSSSAPETRQDIANSAHWDCPSCGSRRAGKYCPHCGERRPGPHDLTLHGLLEQVVETLTHVDGRLFGTGRDLLFKPGALTASFLRGQRKTYVAPFQLFLIVNVAFFAMQSLANLNTFSSRLQSIPYQFGSRVGALIDQRVAALGTTIDAFAPVYDHAAGVNAKSFIILMVLPFAVVTWALFRRGSRPVAAHVVFALHFYAFLLMLIGVVSLAEGAVMAVVGRWEVVWDLYFMVPATAWAVVFVFKAAGRAYEERGFARLAKVAVLTVTWTAIWFGYRFAVFLITLYTTKP